MKLAILIAIVTLLAALLIYRKRLTIYSFLTSRQLNSRGGHITVVNARIWTGDPAAPWKENMTITDGQIIALDSTMTSGRVIDAEGRLVVPGLWDSHTHPHVPFVLFSPEAPMLFGAHSVEDVQERLRSYIEEHPEDGYPRLFGWHSTIFGEGEKPTRQNLDQVASDRPVFLCNNSGHIFWANTQALELAGVFEKDPPDLPNTGRIERDPETGLATGLLEGTEFIGSDGILLRSVPRANPLSVSAQALILRLILEEYSKVGVTAVWAKDGTPDITKLYRRLLEEDSLPVRAIVDTLYTPFSHLGDLQTVSDLAEKLTNDSGLPSRFVRANSVKLLVDMAADNHQAWLFEPYTDGIAGCGGPVFPLDQLEAQALEADRLGLQINFLSTGDRAVHEILGLIAKIRQVNPPRDRRHGLDYVEYIADDDISRFKEIGAIASMNPSRTYPHMDYPVTPKQIIGEERLDTRFQRWKGLIHAGAIVVNGSNFPFAPIDPMVRMHILVNGAEINGNPERELWPDKQISVEDALRTCTTNAAYAAFAEDHLGQLKAGFTADFVMLSEDILDPAFDTNRLAHVKAMLTVLNGHVVHEDFSTTPKPLDFAK